MMGSDTTARAHLQVSEPFEAKLKSDHQVSGFVPTQL